MSVASANIDAWVSAYGPPDRILSDQGPQFVSNFFIAVMIMLAVETAHHGVSSPNQRESRRVQPYHGYPDATLRR